MAYGLFKVAAAVGQTSLQCRCLEIEDRVLMSSLCFRLETMFYIYRDLLRLAVEESSYTTRGSSI